MGRVKLENHGCGLFHLWATNPNGASTFMVKTLDIADGPHNKGSPTPAAWHTPTAARRHLPKVQELQAAASDRARANHAKKLDAYKGAMDEYRAATAAGRKPSKRPRYPSVTVLPLEYQYIEVVQCRIPLELCATCRKHIERHDDCPLK